MLEKMLLLRDMWFLLWHVMTIACLIGATLNLLFSRQLSREETEKIDGGFRW